MTSIKVPSNLHDSDLASKELRSEGKGLMGSATWLGSGSRPDLCVMTSLGQQRCKERATVGDNKGLNALVRRARQWADLEVWISSISIEEWALISTSDASVANAPGLHSQRDFAVPQCSAFRP